MLLMYMYVRGTNFAYISTIFRLDYSLVWWCRIFCCNIDFLFFIGFVNTILSWKGLIPLSRLTYCAYLVHPPVMYYFYYSKKRLIYWDDHEVVSESCDNDVVNVCQCIWGVHSWIPLRFSLTFICSVSCVPNVDEEKTIPGHKTKCIMLKCIPVVSKDVQKNVRYQNTRPNTNEWVIVSNAKWTSFQLYDREDRAMCIKIFINCIFDKK